MPELDGRGGAGSERDVLLIYSNMHRTLGVLGGHLLTKSPGQNGNAGKVIF